MPEIQLNGKTIATQTGTNEPVLKNNVVMESGFSIPSGVTFPAGHVINIGQQITTATNLYNTGQSSTAYEKIDDMDFTYNPIASNSKILIMWNLHLGLATNQSINIRLNVNNTTPLLGAGGSNSLSTGPSRYINNSGADINLFEGKYLYQNTVQNAVVLQLWGTAQNGAFYINRGYSYDDSWRHRTPSYWTIFEIAG